MCIRANGESSLRPDLCWRSSFHTWISELVFSILEKLKPVEGEGSFRRALRRGQPQRKLIM